MRQHAMSGKILAMLPRASAGSSSLWLVLERVLRMLSGIFIAALVARSLGPERFGQMTFALQCLTVVVPFAILGLPDMVMNWLVRERDKTAVIVTQVLLTQLVIGCAIVGLILGAAALAAWPEEMLYIAIAVTSLLPHAFLTLQRYFLSCERGDIIFATSFIAIAIAAALRLWLALTAPSIEGFLLLYLVEQLIMAAALLAAYLFLPESPGLELGRLREAVQRTRVSLPLLPTILAGSIFATMDFFMLKLFSTPEQLGFYGAAVRVTAAWVALQAAVVDGVAATIVRQSSPTDTEASHSLQEIYEVITAISLIMIVIVSLFGGHIALLLYGDAYAGVEHVMVLHIWAALFLGWRKISANWLIADGNLWMTLRRHLPAIAMAAISGPVLIPAFGAVGAAISILAGTFVSGFLFDFVGQATRKHGRAKMRAFLFARLRQRLKKVLFRR